MQRRTGYCFLCGIGMGKGGMAGAVYLGGAGKGGRKREMFCCIRKQERRTFRSRLISAANGLAGG